MCSVPWPLNRSEADGEHVWLQTFLLFMCKLWYSRADKPVNMIIYIRKTRRIVTKQGHRQPRFYSKAGALSAQLLNGLFTLNKLFVVFILYITTNYKCNVYNKDVLLCTNKCVNSQWIIATIKKSFGENHTMYLVVCSMRHVTTKWIIAIIIIIIITIYNHYCHYYYKKQ